MTTTRKKWRLPICSRGQARLLVVGFLVFFFLGVGGVNAQQYTEVFRDDFNRPDNIDMGSGWMESFNGGQPPVQSSRSLNDNKAQRTAAGWGTFSVLLRPTTEKVANGKAEMTFIKNETLTTAPAIFARYNSGTNASFYLAWLLYGNTGTGNVSLQIKRYILGDYLGVGVMLGNYGLSNISDGTPLKVEFEIQDMGINQTKLVATVYSGDSTSPIRQLIVTDTGGTIPAGQWGISSYGSVAFDDFVLYKISTTDLSLSSNVENVEFGDSIMYTISDDENQTVIFSDGNAGGTFSPSDEVILSGDTFFKIITYTPAHLGNITITATSSGLDDTFESNIFVSPYSVSIGFIGDSITARVTNNGTGNVVTDKDAVTTAISKLGSGFIGINKGISGSTTRSRVYSGNLPPTIAAFQNSNVDIVSIMLGSNDANGNFQISSGEYKTNLQTIIDTLKTGGIRQVILQNPIYRDTTDNSYKQRILEYQTSIAELVAENAGYVLQGGIDAYNYFKENTNALGDGLHPTESGHIQLGKFWANTIKSALDYQINPNANFSGAITYTKETTGNLIFRVDKWIGEFIGVKVDNNLLTSGYIVTSGSTQITLESDYLNTLSAGTHTLSVGFNGGVWVESEFTVSDPILETPEIPSTPEMPTAPSSSSSGGGGGGSSLKADSCPAGDFSVSYYDGTCGTIADLAPLVEAKVNLLRSLIRLIYITATEKEKILVHDIITACSVNNKKEIIKLACQDLVKNGDF